MRRCPRRSRRIAAAGYDGVELPGEPERWRPAELRRWLGDHGLTPVALTASCMVPDTERDLAHPDARIRGVAVDYVRRCLGLAAEIGAPLVQMLASGEPRLAPIATRDAEWAWSVAGMQAAAREAERRSAWGSRRAAESLRGLPRDVDGGGARLPRRRRVALGGHDARPLPRQHRGARHRGLDPGGRGAALARAGRRHDAARAWGTGTSTSGRSWTPWRASTTAGPWSWRSWRRAPIRSGRSRTSIRPESSTGTSGSRSAAPGALARIGRRGPASRAVRRGTPRHRGCVEGSSGGCRLRDPPRGVCGGVPAGVAGRRLPGRACPRGSGAGAARPLTPVLDHVDPAELREELARGLQQTVLTACDDQECALVPRIVVRHASLLAGRGRPVTTSSVTLGRIIQRPGPQARRQWLPRATCGASPGCRPRLPRPAAIGGAIDTPRGDS